VSQVERWLCLAVAILVATGCSTTNRPRVYAYPARGQTTEQVSRDTAECEAWARQQTGFDPSASAGTGAAVGAVVGALGGAAAGAAIGAAAGSPGKGAAIGAVAGGVGGTAVGAATGYSRDREGYERAYAACMAARGYEVSADIPRFRRVHARRWRPTVVVPATPTAVVYPTGRYELRGDGITTPYQWVWIPTPPPPPPPPPAPAAPPPPPPAPPPPPSPAPPATK
jgi:outer membrane lipoprotein SlyB